MTQEKIVSNVKSRLGKTQVSDKTIIAVIAANPLADGVEPDDAYFDKIKIVCESIQGNINAVIKDTKAEWEKASKDAKEKEETTSKESKVNDDEKDKYEARIKALEESFKGITTKTAIDALRKDVLNKSTELNVSKKNLWNDVVNALSISADSKAEDLLTTAKTTYEEKLKSYFGDGASPYGKSTDAPQNDSKEVFDNFFKQMKAEGKMGQDKE